jgi:hypothetical protein
MSAQTLTFASIGRYRRVCWWIAAMMALMPLLNSGVILVREHPVFPLAHPTEEAPPVAPTAQTLPPAVMPALRAALAADDARDYIAVAAAPDMLRAANPAQRFDATFAADGVRVAPASNAAWTLRAAAITTDTVSVPLADVAPTVGARVEYRRDGLTEWYANGPRGLEQGFTLDAAPAGGERFMLGLVVAGERVTRAGDGALLIGGLRYGGRRTRRAARSRHRWTRRRRASASPLMRRVPHGL